MLVLLSLVCMHVDGQIQHDHKFTAQTSLGLGPSNYLKFLVPKSKYRKPLLGVLMVSLQADITM